LLTYEKNNLMSSVGKLLNQPGHCVIGACLVLGLVVGRTSLQAAVAAEGPGRQTVVTESGSDPVVLNRTDLLTAEVDAAIDVTSRRYLSAEIHTPWQIMHGVLALGREFRIKEHGTLVFATDWIARGQSYAGEPWFERTAFGVRTHPYSRPYAFEGHTNQFLAILASAELTLDFELAVDGRGATIADLVHHAQLDFNDADEITWTLWALSHYLPPDTRWTDRWNRQWSIEQLVDLQLRRPITEGACGGTHALYALCVARNRYLAAGRSLEGQWLNAERSIQRHIELAKLLQNSDGSFSTAYFTSTGHSDEIPTRLTSSGHTLEFLVAAVPRRRLDEVWVRNGIAAVARDLVRSRSLPLDCGAMYHSLAGLKLYRKRAGRSGENAD
jgi:hypothetical protein